MTTLSRRSSKKKTSRKKAAKKKTTRKLKPHVPVKMTTVSYQRLVYQPKRSGGKWAVSPEVDTQTNWDTDELVVQRVNHDTLVIEAPCGDSTRVPRKELLALARAIIAHFDNGKADNQ